MWRGRWESRIDGPRAWLTYAEFEQLRDHVDGVSAVMATQSSISTWQVRVEGDGRAGWEEARGRLVSGGFFAVLGVSPAIGRVFTTDADRVDTDDVVISYNYWQRRFGGRTDILGKTLTVRSTPVTIIGVAPSGFVGETTVSSRISGCRSDSSLACCRVATGCATRRRTRRCGCTSSAG